MSENNNPWIENTGTVPDGVGPDTVIEVEYRGGEVTAWVSEANNPMYWTLTGIEVDVIRWRFV